MAIRTSEVQALLDHYVEQYNQKSFVEGDPISIPHRFSKRQDIEIAGLFAAVLSWGQRKTIINKSNMLMELMDNSPYDFILNHAPKDRKRFEHFVHRTFQYTDTLYFLTFLQHHYQQADSLETLFLKGQGAEQRLAQFHDSFFALPEAPHRTRKHMPTPVRKSTCKRINMYLRWMVRKDEKGVDFGIWNQIKPSELLIPLDVHVDRVARRLGLLTRKQTDWKSTVELTEALRKFDPEDPVKYDFALFSIGVLEKDKPVL